MKRSTNRPRSRAYRMLLWLFPKHVRRSFGEDMEELFAQQHARVGGVARGRLWLRAIADAVRHGLGGRVERARWTVDRRPWTRYRREAASSSSRWWMDTLRHDFRYAVRTMFRQPGLTATILVTLALGIGANTAVFSVVHAVLLRPLPYSEPERLVMVFEQRPTENRDKGAVSPADFFDWARLSTSFTGMAAHSTRTADLTGVGDPVQLLTATVAPRFFDVLGVKAMLGRTFAPGEDAFGQHQVVVLSHALWQQRFGADRNVVGRSIALNGMPHEIIGVLPRDFEFPGERSDVWAPLALRETPQPPGRANHFLSVYARLKPGVSIDMARAELNQIGSTLAREYPLENEGHGPNVVPLREEIVGPARGGLLVVMSAVAFLLLIACTNVTNLLLARSVGRRREMAIRSAVGAARSRLLRQALTESLLLSAVGGALGLIVASWTVQLLVAETPPLLSGAGLDRARLDIPVLLFTTLLCAVTGLVAGVLPAWQASREEPVAPLREGGRSPAALRRGVRFALIATEVALSVLMLVGAGLMLRSFIRVLSQPPGIETANRLTVNLTLPQSRYPDADARRRARVSLDERLNSIPGVIAAGANNNLPLTGADSRQGVSVEGRERSESDPPTRAHLRIVTPRYFEAAGIVLRSGRFFSATDDARAPLAVVINETMARRYWPGQSPIGRRLRFFEDPWREVIGVVGDVKHWGLDREVNPELYMPYDQQPSATLTYVLHTASSPESVVAAVDAHVKAVDRDLPLGAVRTFEDVAAKSVATHRWSALLLGMFALLGVVLAGAGIYGVMAHLVSMRTGEIGIRMTLGARPGRVLRQVLSEALTQASVGLAFGLVAAYATMRAIQSLLFEVRAADPIAFVAASTVVLIVAGLAGIIPAVRAMRVDPVKALRAE